MPIYLFGSNWYWGLRMTKSLGSIWMNTLFTQGAILCVWGDRKWTFNTTTVTHMLEKKTFLNIYLHLNNIIFQQNRNSKEISLMKIFCFWTDKKIIQKLSKIKSKRNKSLFYIIYYRILDICKKYILYLIIIRFDCWCLKVRRMNFDL